ncbi:hypothetical protein LPW36_11405 [Jinshanibacter sp. LJY008]|uniref:Uncharacterized protein n=1 Tax=Limnobaculum eriocheiris TaxID=2897391 RepID=A0A9X1MXU4_9GAMM|nr:hypothetical protein [Limnobaculum eriocheiris]MCD1126595.1 hypothetical protein [Limnobaculum eriocheiris]
MTNDEMMALETLKKERKNKNIELLMHSSISYIEYPLNQTMVIPTSDGKICFYPTSNKIQHRGRVFEGNAEDLIRYVMEINQQT